MSIKYPKLTILAFFSFIIITISTIVAFAANIQQTPSVKEIEPEQEISQHIEDIAQKYFNNSENTNNAKQILPEAKLKELEGHINKEYGIREDILRFIEREIPANNIHAIRAAIKFSQRINFIYYHANQAEAIKASTHEIIAMHCLGEILSGDERHKIINGINSLMRNNPERDMHMWDIDKRYFSWKVIGFGNLSTKKLNEICENETY